MKTFTVISIFLILCLFFPQAAFSQEFSSLDNDLETLENLIINTLSSTREQQILVDDLRKNLDESAVIIENYGNIITGQENLLVELREQLNGMSETYRMQSALSARYERSSRFWRNFTFIAIPVAAFLGGGVVWAIMSK